MPGGGRVNARGTTAPRATNPVVPATEAAPSQSLHESIADDLRSAIARGDYPAGTQLPTESALVARYGAARGTIRAALQAIEAEGLLASRRGTPRVVLATALSQSFAELRSFAQWARTIGRTPGGRFITRELRPAEPAEARALQIEPHDDVLYAVRLRTLDDVPIFVERCAYPAWLADTVLELEPDCPSVTAEIALRTGLVLASGTHTIDLARADEVDAELLGISVGDPVLRRRGVTRKADGTACDYTEDHYVEGAAAFTLHNSVTSNALSRQIHGAGPATPRHGPSRRQHATPGHHG
jgi:GntR family transcriptional regulator